jgi:hypothetical protein
VKLEVGKLYVLKNGDVVRVKSLTQGSSSFPVECDFVQTKDDAKWITFTIDGLYSTSPHSYCKDKDIAGEYGDWGELVELDMSGWMQGD